MTNIKLTLALLLVSCSSGNDNPSALRAAVDDATVKLGRTVAIAETSMPNGHAVTAELRLDPVEYAVGVTGDALRDVRVDTHSGAILSTSAAGPAAGICPGAISLADAIAKAEARIAGGTVIAAIPDDDVECAREIQVLAPDLLWEVKIAGDGTILEVEESDETED